MRAEADDKVAERTLATATEWDKRSTMPNVTSTFAAALPVLRLARAMWTHFNNVVTTQRQLADSFTELGQKSPELQEEFAYNAETQKALVRNGETLLGKLSHIYIQ